MFWDVYVLIKGGGAGREAAEAVSAVLGAWGGGGWLWEWDCREGGGVEREGILEGGGAEGGDSYWDGYFRACYEL